MGKLKGYLVYSFFIVVFYYSGAAVAQDLATGQENNVSLCKNETIQNMCRNKCGELLACLMGNCFCLQPAFDKSNVQETSQLAESQEIRLLPNDVDISEDEDYSKPLLRHHIAHFCPDLEKARQCIKNCLRYGKPAFCGKDHTCYCGHRYGNSVNDEKLDTANMYAQFKDLYAKYLGTE